MILRLFLLFVALFGFAHTASAFETYFVYGESGNNFYIECSDVNNFVTSYKIDTGARETPVSPCANYELPTVENFGGLLLFSNGIEAGEYIVIEMTEQVFCEDQPLEYCKNLGLPHMIVTKTSLPDFFTFFVPLQFAIMTPLTASEMLSNVSNGVKDTGSNIWVIVALAISIPLTWHIMHLIIETMPDEKTK